VQFVGDELRREITVLRRKNSDLKISFDGRGWSEQSPKDPTPTSIVIVNYNGGSFLGRCIESLRQHTADYGMVLVDNASTDGSLDSVIPGPDLRILRLNRNVGFAPANNIGIRTSSSRYVVLLNSDTIVTPLWLEGLVAEAERSADIGLVTPKLLRPGNPSKIDSTGHLYQYETGLAADKGSNQLDQGQYELPADLPSCSFACVLIKRVVLERMGGLDEKMFFYYEDVDFCIRARTAGWRVVYCPTSVVYHFRGRSTSGKLGNTLVRRAKGYPIRVILRNYETKNMVRFAGRSILLDVIRIFAGMKNFDIEYSREYAGEILWNLTHFPLKHRIAIGRLRKTSDKLLFQQA
jgi:GT2 family glycosyltransferase